MAGEERAMARELERELNSMRAYLEEKESALVKTAELGKALLRENGVLEERLVEANGEATQRIEELEQERFSLQQRLECQKAALQAVQHETDSVRIELKHEYEMREEHLKQAHSKKQYETESLVSDLRGENERLETQLKTGRERTAVLEERLREMTEQAESVMVSSFLQPDIRELEEKYTQERSEREEVEAQLGGVQEDCRLLEMEVEELAGKVERLTEECRERSDQANQWYKALQGSKERVLELNAELDSLKMDLGNSRGTSGNSLFGEVDDRRLQVERKYVSLQVKHESLEKRHNTMSQQYKRLKADMSSLLCQFSVVGADAAHIRRLEVALRQAQSEKETLLTKLHKLEKQQASVLASQERLQYVAAFGDKKEYIALIEGQLSSARKENSVLTKDREKKGLQLVWETQKLRETEAKLHRKEQEMARGQKEMSVVKLKFQELQEKLDKAESSCKEQVAQVQLLEKELQHQRSSRGGTNSHRHTNTSHRGDAAINSHSHSHSSTSNTSSTATSSSDQHTLSLAGELAGCEVVATEKHETDGGKEKENRVSNSPQNRQKKGRPGGASFLEEVEREFEKKAATAAASEKKTQHSLLGTGTKFRGSVRLPDHMMGTKRDPKVNQCPQQ